MSLENKKVLSSLSLLLKTQTQDCFYADPPGFEPRLTGPKPVVLPLHHGSLPCLGVQMYKFFLFYKHLNLKILANRVTT